MIAIGEILLVGVVTVLTVLALLVGIQLYKILQSLQRILRILQQDMGANQEQFWQKFTAAQKKDETKKQTDQVMVGLKSGITSSPTRRSFQKNGKQLN